MKELGDFQATLNCLEDEKSLLRAIKLGYSEKLKF